MKKPVILERINSEWFLWKVFLYFPTEEEVKKALEEEKRLFPKKDFCFSSFEEVADF